MLSLNQHS